MRRLLLALVVLTASATAAVTVADRRATAQSTSSPCVGLIDLVNGGFEDRTPSRRSRSGTRSPCRAGTRPSPTARSSSGRAATWASRRRSASSSRSCRPTRRASLPGAPDGPRRALVVRREPPWPQRRRHDGDPDRPARRPAEPRPAGLDRQHGVAAGAGQLHRPARPDDDRFGFAAVSNASGNRRSATSSTGSLRRRPLLDVDDQGARAAGDPGRFDLLVGDDVVVPGAGNGSSSTPLPLPLSAVRWRSARRWDRPRRLRQRIRCVDADSQDLVAQGPGSELSLSFDRGAMSPARSRRARPRGGAREGAGSGG